MIVKATRAEWFKVVRRPSIWVTIGLLLALSIGLEYLIVYLVATHPPRGAGATAATLANLRVDLYPASLVKKTLTNVSGLYGIFALIIGVLVQGSEYSWGTFKTTHIQLPGRITILGGQLIALGVLVLVMAAGLFVVDAAAANVLAVIDSQTITWPSADVLVKGVGAAWMILYFLAVFGFGLATAFRGSAVAIGAGLAYALVIENLVFGLVTSLGDTFKQIQEWFPIANAAYLEQSFGAVRAAAATAASRPPVDGTHAATVLALWLIAIAVASAGLVRTRDVT